MRGSQLWDDTDDNDDSDDDGNNNDGIRARESSAESKLSGRKQEDPRIMFHESDGACYFHASKYSLQ